MNYYFRTCDTQFWRDIDSKTIHGAKLQASKESEKYEEITIASKEQSGDYYQILKKYPYKKDGLM